MVGQSETVSLYLPNWPDILIETKIAWYPDRLRPHDPEFDQLLDCFVSDWT